MIFLLSCRILLVTKREIEKYAKYRCPLAAKVRFWELKWSARIQLRPGLPLHGEIKWQKIGSDAIKKLFQKRRLKRNMRHKCRTFLFNHRFWNKISLKSLPIFCHTISPCGACRCSCNQKLEHWKFPVKIGIFAARDRDSSLLP